MASEASLIPLVPKDESKVPNDSYIDVKINTQGDEMKVQRFTGAENVEVLFKVCAAVDYLKDVGRVGTPTSMVHVLMSLALGPARDKLQLEWRNRNKEISKTNAELEKDYENKPNRPPAQSFEEEDYERVRERWVRHYVKRSALEKQEMWMLSIMEKPSNLSIRAFYSRVEQLISYGKYYPRPVVVHENGSKCHSDQATPLNDKQKSVLLLRAVPA
ncbi:MAG: hypothetical protein ACREOZ_00445, partial [Gloeomargaritales cyanobacterium]